MKKIFLLITTSFFLSHLLIAQNEIAEFDGKVKWSEMFDISSRIKAPDIIGQDGKFVYFKRAIGNKTYIESYNIKTLQIDKSVQLNPIFKNKKLELLGVFMYNRTPVLYTGFYNMKTQLYYTFVQPLDKSTLQPSTPIVTSKTKVPKKDRAARMNENPLVESKEIFLVSEDNQLSYSYEFTYAENTSRKEQSVIKSIKGRLFDENFKLIVENDFVLPYDKFRLLGTKLSNDGLIYMAGNEYSTQQKDIEGLIKREETVYGELKILVLDIQTAKIEVLTVSFPDRKIKNFTFKTNDDGSLTVSGLTGEEEGGVTGCFIAKYDADLTEIAINLTDFEEEFLTQGWSEKSLEKLDKLNEKEEKKGKEQTKPTFFNYEIRELIVKPDGTTTLLAEQYYIKVVTRTSTNSNGVQTVSYTYYYYYNDIIALNFDKNGELLWKTVIEKYQSSVNDEGYYSSFFTILQGNDINIIYNEQASNMAETENMSDAEKKKLRRNVVGKRVLLSADGEQSSDKIFEFEDGGLRLVPKVCGPIDENTAFIYARAVSGDKIGLIEW